MGEHDIIEGMQRHCSSPGYAVTKWGSGVDRLINQMLTTGADCCHSSAEYPRAAKNRAYRL